MSGLVAIVDRSGGPVDPADLDGMLAAMPHRGPDGRGAWIGESAALGHLEVAAVAVPAHDGQPIVDSGQSLAIAADARLSDTTHLRDALGDPWDGEPVSDARLLLAAYAEWGDRCVERLVGAFAFVVWDATKRTLFCARDHFGQKPLFFARAGERFACASESKALLALGWVPARLNRERTADYVLDLPGDVHTTFFRDVERLVPAHTLQVDGNGVSSRRYFALDTHRELRLPSDHDYALAFEEAFDRAVRRSLATVDRPAVSLSGGLDSSSVTGVALHALREQGRLPLETFSLLYDSAPGGDERHYIEAVTAQEGIAARFIPADATDPLDRFDEFMRHMEEPVENPLLALGGSLAGGVAEHGVKALLDGDPGDGVVAYELGYLGDLVRRGRLLAFMRESVGLARHLYDDAVSPFELAWHEGIRPLLTRVLGESEGRPAPVRRDAPEIAAAVDRARVAARGPRASARERHVSYLTDTTAVRSAEVNERLSAWYGLEPRHPFWDRELVELCVALPREQRVREGWTRFVMRHALAARLPEEIRHRGGKWTPNRYFLRRLTPERVHILAGVVERSAPALEAFADLDRVRESVARLGQGPTLEDAFPLVRMAALAGWMNAYGVKE